MYITFSKSSIYLAMDTLDFGCPFLSPKISCPLAFPSSDICVTGVKNQQFRWCAGAMDNFYLDNNKSYNTLSYNVLHKFLAKRLHVCYAKFRPARARKKTKTLRTGR